MEATTQAQPIESVETAASASPDPKAPPSVIRCIARTRDGRRCRLRAKDAETHLCSRHAVRDAAPDRLDDSVDLSSEILNRQDGDYADTDTINSILSNVVELVAAGRLSTRRAAVITYSLSLMLRSSVIAQRDAPFPQLPEWCYRNTPPPDAESSGASTSPSAEASSGSAPSQPNSTASPSKPNSQPMSPYDAIEAYNRLRS